MKTLLLVAASGVAIALPAQQFAERHRQQFDEPLTGTLNTYAVYSLAFADIDGDGDLDVVADIEPGGGASNRVFGYANDGSGHFGSAVDLGLSIGARTDVMRNAGIADLNGDGIDDFVVEVGFPGSPAVWLSTAPGTWSTVPCPAAGPGVRFADLDGDGDLDWVVPGSPVTVVRNDAGSFVVPFSLLPLPTSTSVALGDTDGDGDIDILMDQVLFVQLLPMQFVPGLLGGSAYHGVDAGLFDVDGDGDLDVLGPQAYWRNSGIGTFTNAIANLPPGAQTFVDWDGDGFVDVGVGSDVWRNDGTGAFVLQPGWSTASPSARFPESADGDANGDGKPDRVGGTWGIPAGGRTTSSTWGTLSLALNDGARLREVSGRGLHYRETNTGCALAGDVDGDGDGDVLLLSGTPSELLRSQWGQFDDPVPGPSGSAPLYQSYPLRMVGVLADLDGDGDPDVVGPNGDVWRSDGSGGFTRLATLGGYNVAGGDLDGDGDVDLVTIGNSGQVFRNLGNAVFQPVAGGLSANLDPLVSLFEPVLADIDGDGDLDLFLGTVGFLSAQPDRLFLNQGNGVFVEAAGRLPAVPAATPDATAADFDGDGDVDILTANGPYYQNLGGGVFGASTLNVGVGFHLAADLDEDGDLDVATLSGFSYSVLTWWRNDGGGSYVPQQLTGNAPHGGGPTSIAAFDCDGDLDLDLVVTTYSWDFTSGGAVPRLFTNRQRDLDAPSHLRIGATFAITVRSQAPVGGSHAALLAAGVPLPTRTLLPQIGWLALDPSTLLVLGFTVLPAASPEQAFAIPVPADPVLLGATLGFQALVGTSGAPHLTNAVVETAVR